MNKIQQFIKDNKLNFSGCGSNLNGNCVILAGYALYLHDNENDFEGLLTDIEQDGIYNLTSEGSVELKRVFDYAYKNDYYNWWNSKEAKEKYKF